MVTHMHDVICVLIYPCKRAIVLCNLVASSLCRNVLLAIVSKFLVELNLVFDVVHNVAVIYVCKKISEK